MSPLGKTTTKKTEGIFATLRCYILPAYVVLSALFIIYIAYGYLKVAVYQTGAQNGYNGAYNEIVRAALDPQSCQGLNIPSSDGQTTVTLINVNCLQPSWEGDTSTGEQ